jgi:hypothetical protein
MNLDARADLDGLVHFLAASRASKPAHNSTLLRYGQLPGNSTGIWKIAEGAQ